MNKAEKKIKEFELIDAVNHCNYVLTGTKKFDKKDWEFEKLDSGFMVYAGKNSPLSQAIGVGLENEISQDLIEKIEEFYFNKKCNVNIEISSIANNTLEKLFIQNNYKNIETTNLLIKQFDKSQLLDNISENIKSLEKSHIEKIAQVTTNGFTNGEENQELNELFKIYYQLEGFKVFYFKSENDIVGAGIISISGNNGILCGASTLKEFRRKGVQSELIKARINYAINMGVKNIFVLTEDGSGSEQNFLKKGFKKISSRKKYFKSVDEK